MSRLHCKNRTLRKDAKRNREAVLAAAKQFDGCQVPASYISQVTGIKKALINYWLKRLEGEGIVILTGTSGCRDGKRIDLV